MEYCGVVSNTILYRIFPDNSNNKAKNKCEIENDFTLIFCLIFLFADDLKRENSTEKIIEGAAWILIMTKR